MAVLFCRFNCNACRTRRTYADARCVQREERRALSVFLLFPTHSHSCGGARARIKYVVTLFLVLVACGTKRMPEISTLSLSSAFVRHAGKLFQQKRNVCMYKCMCVGHTLRNADLIDATLLRQHTSRPDHSLEPTWRSSLCSGDIPKTVGTSSDPTHSPTHAALRGVGRLCWTLTVVYQIIGLM